MLYSVKVYRVSQYASFEISMYIGHYQTDTEFWFTVTALPKPICDFEINLQESDLTDIFELEDKLVECRKNSAFNFPVSFYWLILLVYVSD